MIITTTTWPGPNVVQPGIERPTAMRLAATLPGAHCRKRLPVFRTRDTTWDRRTGIGRRRLRRISRDVRGLVRRRNGAGEESAPTRVRALSSPSKGIL